MSQLLGADHFRDYRKSLGFSSQDQAKKFLAAKDVQPEIDDDYISRLNMRLHEIISKIDGVVAEPLRAENLSSFLASQIDAVYEQLSVSGLLLKMNNLGRRREEVYFSWLRGRIFAAYFSKYIAKIFSVSADDLSLIGDDEVLDPEVFRKTPTADLEIVAEGLRVRVEVQSGFQGVNDIKQHKVLEAKRVLSAFGVETVVVHFDVFNGQVALVLISSIPDDDINWITRQQLEGQTVFNISQNHFLWGISEVPTVDLGEFFAQ